MPDEIDLNQTEEAALDRAWQGVSLPPPTDLERWELRVNTAQLSFTGPSDLPRAKQALADAKAAMSPDQFALLQRRVGDLGLIALAGQSS